MTLPAEIEFLSSAQGAFIVILLSLLVFFLTAWWAFRRPIVERRTVFVAAQEGEFMGGGVGEVHGAKLVGMLRRALRDKPDAVLLLAEPGGVRLHEACKQR